MWKPSDLSRVTQLTGDRKPWNSGWRWDLTAEPTEYKHQEWSGLHSSCPGLPALLAAGAAPVSSQRAFPSPCSALPPGLPLPSSKALPPPLSPCPHPAKVLPSFSPSCLYPPGYLFLAYTLEYSVPRASPGAQTVKHLPAMRETWVLSLGREDPLEKEMATHPRILAWKTPWTDEPGGLESTGLQSLRHD